MRRRLFVGIALAAAGVYVFGTAVLAFSQWYGPSDSWPVVTFADVVTGWATIPRHALQYVLIRSWNVGDAPEPVTQLAWGDAITTGLVVLVNVVVVVILTAAQRRWRRGSRLPKRESTRSAAW